MATLPLRFKMKFIRQFEKKNGPLLKVMNKLASAVENVKDGEEDKVEVSDSFFDTDINGLIVDFVIAGNMGCEEARAEEIVDDFYEAGGDMEQALKQIIEALKKGFFPRK